MPTLRGQNPAIVCTPAAPCLPRAYGRLAVGLGAWRPQRQSLAGDRRQRDLHFTPTTSGPPLAHTARGEEILHSFLEWGLVFPPQQLPVTSFHPYNTAMLSRRIDYVLCRSFGVHPCRHQASSDHDAVWCGEPAGRHRHRRPACRWGPRHLSEDHARATSSGPSVEQRTDSP